MSLVCVEASTDSIACGSAAVLDDLTVGSVIFWLNPSSVANATRVLIGKTTNTGSTGWFMARPSSGGSVIRIVVNRATTDMLRSSSAGVLVVGTPSCIAATWDVSADTCSIYHGTLAAALADVGGTLTAGSGAYVSDAAESYVIGNAGAASLSAGGAYSYAAVFNRVLTLAELQSWQLHPRKMAGCVAFHELGLTGVGSQWDYSGNGNTGTITGATQSAHLPRRWLTRMAAA